MKKIGKLQPTANARSAPDTVATVVVSSAGAITAADYPTGASLMKMDTDTAAFVNLTSTAVHLPAASIAATTSSSGLIEAVSPQQDKLWQINGSTGYSVTAETTAIITLSLTVKSTPSVCAPSLSVVSNI